jgi:transposase
MGKKINFRQRRVFSEAIKKQVVQDIEKGKASVFTARHELGVAEATIYSWLNKYSRNLQSSKVMVIQMKSEAYKSKELEKRIQELEAALGRKQLEVDFLNTLIDQGKKELGVDLKKKFSTPPFTGSDLTKGDSGTK